MKRKIIMDIKKKGCYFLMIAGIILILSSLILKERHLKEIHEEITSESLQENN